MLALDLDPVQRPASVGLEEEFGWRRIAEPGRALWFKGHLYGTRAESLLRLAAGDADQVRSAVAALDGHFALVLESGAWTLAATDRVASVPLLYAGAAAGAVIDGSARRLVARLGLGEIDPDGALAIGMAGYTVGPHTLHRGLEALGPGESVLFRPGAVPERRAYYSYVPAPTAESDRARLRKRLHEVHLRVFEKLAADAAGRPILVPLSAGLDSRLVASGLRHLGYRNVRCFSYGLPGNFEAEGARRVAAALGYPWTFVPFTPRQQSATFADPDCAAFVGFADSGMAIPFQQDFHAVRMLARSGYAPADAILVNGQSGDYLTGNHIPEPLHAPPPHGLSVEGRWRRIFDAIVAKHFSLWECLKTPANLGRIERLLRADLERLGARLGDPADDFAPFEASEYRNRQSKYVIAGQRSYEFFGYAWRLPLWDRDYIDFWAAAPLSAKRRQSLYRETLEAENYGGVWGAGWTFPRRAASPWLGAARALLRAAHAPLGRRRWHAFERRYLAWPMDVVANYAIAPYWRVARDRRGHRNAISWHAEAYLAAKGLSLAGLERTGDAR
jgi:asparagine synthase (glutamine-hydrolysing)